MHRASMEVISGFIRVWADGTDPGDPWTYGINFRGLPGQVASQSKGCELFGADRAPTPSERRAIGRLLHSLGFEWFLRTRGDGTQTTHSVYAGRV